MTAQPYVVVGAGAIGGTIAHALIRAGHHVTLIDTDAAHIAALRAGGLTILRDDGPAPVEDTVAVPAAYTPDDAPLGEAISAAIVAVKSQHTADAAAWLADGRLAADGYAVSLQNGANERVLSDALGDTRVLGAFVDIFADWDRPGVIRYGGPGALAVGLPDTGVPDARVLRTARDLRAYGPVTSTANLTGYRWAKRGFGSILGLATLVDEPLADVVAAYPDLAFLAANESTEVAVRAGITLESFDAYEPYAFQTAAPEDVRRAAVRRLTEWLATQPKTRSGVYRDIAVRRRPLEHGLLDDGYDVLAAEHGVDLAFGREVRRRLGTIVDGSAGFGREHLDALRASFVAR